MGRLGGLVALGEVYGVDYGLDNDVNVLHLLVLAVVGNGERRASKGSNGEGERGAHLD